jgi:3-oxoacyl-[acyl-carrier protein] reductase
MIPMGRIGTGDECAGAILYPSSHTLSGYVTERILEVNDGLPMP